MTRSRALLLAFATAFLVGACAGGAAPSAPSAPPPGGGGPVTTPEDAVARIIAQEPRLAGIRPRDPDLIGQSAWYEVARASGVGAFLVTMRVGWGDCQAGCIAEHTWLYAIAPDGTVTLQSEGGPAVPPDAWPSPAGDGVGDDATGIHITAVAGPTCPVEQVPPDPACAPKPVAGATVAIVDDGGQEHATVVLDAAGQAFVKLDAGTYTVNGQGVAGFMGGPEAQRVVVEDGRVTEVTLAYDTGIR